MGAVLLECRHSLQLFLQAWGIFCLFLAWSSTVCQCLWKTDSPHLHSTRVCWAGAETWEWLPCWKGSCSEFQLSGCRWVPRVRGDQSAVPEHGAVPGPPSQLGARHSRAFTRRSQGKKLQFCAAWHFLRKLLLFFKAENRSYLGKCG